MNPCVKSYPVSVMLGAFRWKLVVKLNNPLLVSHCILTPQQHRTACLSVVTVRNFKTTCRLKAETVNHGLGAKEKEEETKFDEDKDAEMRREKLKRNTQYGMYFMSAATAVVGMYAIFLWGQPKKDSQGEIIRDEFSDHMLPVQYTMRAFQELRYWSWFIKEPSREKLLPDPLKEPYYQPKYTLVVELTGVLVHPDWTYGTGWRFKKRPAVEYFLSQVGYPNFEVVIYTNEQGLTAMPIIENLDPQQMIMWKLFRDATKYEQGHHIKDLSKLNRDLSKVIFLEWDPNGFQLQPENALRVPKWEGDDSDTALVDLAQLLTMIRTSNVDDVRPIVQFYSEFDNPAKEFRERSLRMAQSEQTSSKQDGDKNLANAWSGKLFGFRRHS